MSKELIVAAAAANEDDFSRVPLRDWMAAEMQKTVQIDSSMSSLQHSVASGSKESIIRKTTIAYGISELILRCSTNNHEQMLLRSEDDVLHVDNFTVHVSKTTPRQQPWDDITGMSMRSPQISLTIEEPAYLSCLFEPGDDQAHFGRHLEVEETVILKSGTDELQESATATKDCAEKSCGVRWFHSIAKIFYEIFTNEAFAVAVESSMSTYAMATAEEPALKKIRSSHQSSHPNIILPSHPNGGFDVAQMPFRMPSVIRMQQKGIPSSLCLMVQSLLEAASMREDNQAPSDDAYKSLKDVAKDLHLLLLDPNRFLFDINEQSLHDRSLRYRKNKLYGRDKEEKLITDAFCRVSRGKNEAFFIEGFSGCGKSMLVNTLRERVDSVGGYVIKHKFDELSQERSLSGVISAVNQLCFMIKERNNPHHIATLTKKLRDEFGADLVLLARILQNISWICPEFVPKVTHDSPPGGDTMNARSVGFTLLRFLRLISSREQPITLFLDDLQWADDTALDVIHTFLCDTMGTCMFFVGTYRDNEVDSNHPVFDLITKLETCSSSMMISRVALAGLDREDLNTMISDALCLYPRICYSLTDIVLKKTGGNPFFVLEFIKSLKDRDLLRYNLQQKRWTWDRGMIQTENITDNVMHLLSRKIGGLSDNVQMLLKVMACFGTRTKESLISYLNESTEYAGVRDGLTRAVDNGFVERNRVGEIKFVHDKIREAAYDIIPECEKKKFHYNLGKALYSVCKGIDSDDTILLITSQIYYGKDYIANDDELRIPIVKLSMDAGKKAIESCRHDLAYSHLEAASSLLPEDCWESQYDISLRLNFMMADAANSSCKYDEAVIILEKIIDEGRSTKDKLTTYLLLIQIFQAQGKLADAYSTSSSILSQLGETIPESVTSEQMGAMITETLRMYNEVYGEQWLGKRMNDCIQQYVVKFYGTMATTAFFSKDANMIHYITCMMVKLSLLHGACQDTPIAFLKLSNMINKDGNNAALAHRIADNAMSLSNTYNSSEQNADLNFEFVYSVGYLELFHLGVHRLHEGFESSLSSGNANMGFLCAAQSTLLSIISGVNNLALLKEIDFYLHLLGTYKNEMTKRILLICRKTVSMITDKGESTSIPVTEYPSNTIPRRLQDLTYVLEAIENYWLGYSKRSCHFAQKILASLPKPGRLYRVVVLFYHGLNLIDMLQKKLNAHRKREVKEIIASMRVIVQHAESNFKNKLELLEAEKYALEKKHEQAEALYDAAIASAKNYKFIHEQGLACEKAGFYYKKRADYPKAASYFQQSLACYKEWGSSVKIDMIQKELDDFNVQDESETMRLPPDEHRQALI